MSVLLAFTVAAFPYGYAFPSQAAEDRYWRIVCSRPDVAVIRDDDPALPLFRRRGYPLKDAKIDLAVERANSCDSTTGGHDAG